MPNLPAVARLHKGSALARLVRGASSLRKAGSSKGCLLSHRHTKAKAQPLTATHAALAAAVISRWALTQTQSALQELAFGSSGRIDPSESTRSNHKSRLGTPRTCSYRNCAWVAVELDPPRLIPNAAAAGRDKVTMPAQFDPIGKDEDKSNGLPHFSEQPLYLNGSSPRTSNTRWLLVVAHAPAQAWARTSIRCSLRVRHIQWNSCNARGHLLPRKTPVPPYLAWNAFKEAKSRAELRPAQDPYSSTAHEPALRANRNRPAT